MHFWHNIAGLLNISELILILVIFVLVNEKACCETVIAGQNVTLSCSIPSSSQTANWIEKTKAKFPNVLSVCEADKQKCDNNQEYGKGNLHHFALQNATHSWITVSSQAPGNYTIACKLSDGDDGQQFNLTFLDADKIQSPRCDVFPYENDASKVKFKCEVDITRGFRTELEIIGAGENIQAPPDLVYSIVDYNHFIDASNVMCRIYVLGINKSCDFPRGIRIYHVNEGDDAVFEIEADFKMDDLVIDWHLVKIDKLVVDTTSYSLWYGDKTTSMLFRSIGSRNDTEGIFVRCQITRSDENQNVSTIVGVGFFSLGSDQFEQSDGTHGETESSLNGITIGSNKLDVIKEYKFYIMLACAFFGPLVISTGTAIWLIRKCGKKRQSTCVMSVKQVTLISTFYQGFKMSILPRVINCLVLLLVNF